MVFDNSGAAIILPFDKKMNLWQPDSIKAKPMGGSTLSNSPLTPGVVAGRLPDAALARNFSDHEAPFDQHEARVAADRCYFCHDAPCQTACPTSIDIPMFILDALSNESGKRNLH